ncbi:bifunctional 3-(3-hydroxy-phenyl)propionate/3-hydroxycinnamic acid hydroxylase [Falsiroseomonas sp. HW251]|uniref:bifunctional 3-(3-hydroxy-phenyl)propionate/3-hydroxycinnamic acid hydroxylase n=1 Tax=Falsiroseomonas sp. HW251 TaxID=3390998 RepID=UPI003D31BB9A
MTQVLVVGAGPTGLTLANLLGVMGVRTLLVERNSTTVQEPRAVSIDDEALRTLQAAGLVEQVLKHVVPGYGSHYHGPDGSRFATVEPTGTPYGYPRRNAFRQPRLEAQLSDGLARFPHVETRFGWQLESFQAFPDGVEATMAGPMGRQRIVCDFVVGCDGASSTVRASLGIQLSGTSFDERWLIVDLENSANTTKHTRVFCDIRRPCITLPGPDRTRRYEFKLLPGESDAQMLEPAVIARLLREHEADPDATIRRTVVYRFHARVAPRWCVGRRIFLAGDAAHLTPPFAGQGMNSGLRDAQNLAWKLSAVLDGRAGPALLDSYDAERRDHMWQMIKLALRMGRIMAPPSALHGVLTRAAFRALNVWPPARDYVAQMKYKPKPRFEHGFLVSDRRGARRTRVGRLFPQPRVLTGQGPRLLDEVLGNGFALVARDPAGLSALRHALLDRLRVARLAILPRGSASRDGAVALDSAEDPLADHDAEALLLRPDHYVAAALPFSGADPVLSQLEAMLDG